MTQEFVTLPREVVENALDALNEADLLTEHRQDIELRRSALVALRAALEQPQNHVPDTGNMVQAGWKLVPVEPTEEMLRAGCGSESPAMLRESLTDKQIDAIAESMPGGLDGFLKGWGWRQFARAVLEAAPQPPTIKECLTDELKPRFSAHDDAERLKSVARGMSYNDHGEAVWKHTMMEIAVRLESGGYAAPQPPALEQQVEKESTCKDSLQVEQEPVAVVDFTTEGWRKIVDALRTLPDGAQLYAQPQQQREPLTREKIAAATGAKPGTPMWLVAVAFTRAVEAAHDIK